MSTLVAQTISNGTVSTSSANVIQGSAKAWVNFNGTGTVAIRASYNVSSITDNGTGNYTVNFTNALADTNYSVCGMVGGGDNPVWSGFTFLAASGGGTPTTKTTSGFRVLTGNTSNGITVDMPDISFAVFR